MPEPNPTPGVDIKSASVVCQQCGQPFRNFVLEKIAGITQLRSNSMVIRHVRANCMHCGHLFQYDSNDRHAERMAVTYGELLRAVRPGYIPE